MGLGQFPVRASIAVRDIARGADFYENTLGLPLVQSTPSAGIDNGGRIYEANGHPALNVFQSETAGASGATMATWYVNDIDQVIKELTDAGVVFERYPRLHHDDQGITERAGGGRIAWFKDPDGNTLAIEADE